MMGAVELNSKDNTSLVEKAGREGFRDDRAYRQFRSILINFFIQSAADFFVENGRYSEEWTDQRSELQRLDDIRKQYDKDGEIAASGSVHEALFNELNQLEFYSRHSAKSLGREWFEIDFLRVVEKYAIPVNDIICTVAEHCAFQIAEVLNANKLKNVFVTGGGAKNTFLIKSLKKFYKGEVIIPDEKVIDFKEALIFAFLGYLRLTNQINTLCSVTGAKKDSVGGSVYFVNS